jgi:hypothetical protein
MSSRSAGDATAWSPPDDLRLGEGHIALYHVERRVAEDPLEAEPVLDEPAKVTAE